MSDETCNPASDEAEAPTAERDSEGPPKVEGEIDRRIDENATWLERGYYAISADGREWFYLPRWESWTLVPDNTENLWRRLKRLAAALVEARERITSTEDALAAITEEAKLALQGEDAARERIAALEGEVERAKGLLAPFAEFARQFDAKPLLNIGDDFYNIHTGTEWAASLRLSDCRKAAAYLAAQPAEEGK